MKVSVVIPTYNEEKYLEETLNSIYEGSLKPFEVIIVDSFSNDRTREIALSYNARIITIKERGIALARHIGCSKVVGDIIANTSADVRVDEFWLERLTFPLSKEGGDYDLTYGSIYLKDPDFIENIFSEFLNNFSPILDKLGLVFATADNIALKKGFYKKIGGFNVSMVTGEDTDLIRRAKEHGRVKYVKEAKVFTSSRRIRKWGKLKYFYFHFKNFLKVNLIKKDEKDYEAVR